MAINGKKFVNYLAHNISPSQVATALNITPGRVSQLMLEPKIKDAIDKRKTEIAEEGLTDVADLKSIKKTLISRMGELADGTDSLSEAINALEKIDKMTSTKLGQEDNDSGVAQVIMQVPIFIQNNYGNDEREAITLDSRNRIVGINDRSMAQMPTQGVLDILNRKGKADEHPSQDSGAPIPAKEAIEFDLSALSG